LDEATLRKLQRLVEANFAGRDELYAAANSLNSADRENVCKRLAEHLAANAIELQQILAASGADPASPPDTQAVAKRLFQLAKANRGSERVLDAAESCEINLKYEYDLAIQDTPNREAEAMLERQRDDVEFGQRMIRSMKKSWDSTESDRVSPQEG
jgi:uncharacterized protein (TIGR02284 family)